MSRAFINEDQHEEPIFIPPRAPLPEGQVNYVTPLGWEELKAELKKWDAKLQELNFLEMEEDEQRRQFNFINGSKELLQKRIASAVVVILENQPKDEIRFGAKVILRIDKAPKQSLQIVGVDEADVKKNKIAFTSPLARAILGKKEGETVSLHLGNESRLVQLFEFSY